jgi:outer membrane protein assembly factor BamE (lipoprotein component of BamABCDE complex)
MPQTSRRYRRRVAAVAALALAALVAWEFAGIVGRVKAPPARVDPARLARIHLGDTNDHVQALLGPPELTSDVYENAPFLLQCWYYDLHSAVHLEVCFDHWRVYHTERYG